MNQIIISSLLAIILFFAPLYYSGKSSNALLALELASIIMLIFVLGGFSFKQRINKLTFLLIAIVALTPALYLFPVDLAQWITLPGRESYQASIEWINSTSQTPPELAISLIPYKTIHAGLAIIPALAVFLAVISLEKPYLHKILYLFFAIAAIQAIIGLTQASNPNAQWMESLGIVPSHNNAQGTYLNRDHFSILMVAIIPFCIAFIIEGFKSNQTAHHEQLLKNTLIYSGLFLLFFLAAIFSRSRAGVALALLSFLLASVFFIRHISAQKSIAIVATLSTLGITIATSIGVVPILNRFIVQNPAEDGRWQIFETSIQGIQKFFPIGSGPGTFPEIYRTLQPVEQLRFINHAHNDYLELVFETGALGLFIIVLGLFTYLGGWIQQWGNKWDKSRFIQSAAGISLFLMFLHSFLEFNLHTPANAILFAFLAAIFLQKREQT